jgi:hypothetical protein
MEVAQGLRTLSWLYGTLRRACGHFHGSMELSAGLADIDNQVFTDLGYFVV